MSTQETEQTTLTPAAPAIRASATLTRDRDKVKTLLPIREGSKREAYCKACGRRVTVLPDDAGSTDDEPDAYGHDADCEYGLEVDLQW